MDNITVGLTLIRRPFTSFEAELNKFITGKKRILINNPIYQDAIYRWIKYSLQGKYHILNDTSLKFINIFNLLLFLRSEQIISIMKLYHVEGQLLMPNISLIPWISKIPYPDLIKCYPSIKYMFPKKLETLLSNYFTKVFNYINFFKMI